MEVRLEGKKVMLFSMVKIGSLDIATAGFYKYINAHRNTPQSLF
jgi:hypothetical protein